MACEGSRALPVILSGRLQLPVIPLQFAAVSARHLARMVLGADITLRDVTDNPSEYFVRHYPAATSGGFS